MYANHDRDHAASIDLQIAHASIIYCGACRAWRVVAWIVDSPTEDAAATAVTLQHDCGPFDGTYEVVTLVSAMLLELMNAPGRPGAPGSL